MGWVSEWMGSVKLNFIYENLQQLRPGIDHHSVTFVNVY